jgi:hypothetical protein
MPLIAGRAPRRSGEAHLRRIVAGFSHLLPEVHTTASGKALPAKAQGPTPGISPPVRQAFAQGPAMRRWEQLRPLIGIT